MGRPSPGLASEDGPQPHGPNQQAQLIRLPAQLKLVNRLGLCLNSLQPCAGTGHWYKGAVKQHYYSSAWAPALPHNRQVERLAMQEGRDSHEANGSYRVTE